MLSRTSLRTTVPLLMAVSLLGTACKKNDPAPQAQTEPAAQEKSAALQKSEKAAPVAKVTGEKKAAAEASPTKAAVGQPAPDFSLPQLDGTTVTLSENKGKIVVLEWFNPECPFVKAAHTKGSLADTAERLMKKGVVYLAINSGAPGKQGHGIEKNQAGKETFKLKHPILLDETGAVGRSYGATNTPHLFVINAEGLLAYAGAADNSPDGEGQSPEGGKLIRTMERAVDELLDGKPVSQSGVKAYGCSVKYGK